ncbi:TPA: hypothetical protein DCZ39_02500 [Patescibacteria group bacterium]|nr:hypothetical protein [Candidatus Gracilibacteria bacterium]
MVERETIPTETRLGQLKDIIKKIKEIAFGDEDPESYIFSIDFSLIRNKEEEILSDTFTEKRMDIIIAMRTYSVVKKTIKEYKKEIEQKYEVKN